MASTVTRDSTMASTGTHDSTMASTAAHDSTMSYTGGIQAGDRKPSRDPRDWTCDQVVGNLCRMDGRLLVKDLGPLFDQKVVGDVLLRCSLDVLLKVLKLDFNTAIRVNEQITKLKIVVRGLDVIVIK
eukprot:GFUD01106009.1.p2 GENE.GFUD01106009.1~~GFUD01106009.1.p2  ORF type:complete len:150 (+),score=21.12 GFUD01106009.1:67-450(+)